jgi:hypothetical protein
MPPESDSVVVLMMHYAKAPAESVGSTRLSNFAAYAGNGSASVSEWHILETETVMGADHSEASFGSLALPKSAPVNEHLFGACNGTLLDRGSGFRNL